MERQIQLVRNATVKLVGAENTAIPAIWDAYTDIAIRRVQNAVVKEIGPAQRAMTVLWIAERRHRDMIIRRVPLVSVLVIGAEKTALRVV